MLSESLRGVIAQTLLPKKGGGRVAALEVLIVTPAISNLIREGKTFQIPSAMQTEKSRNGHAHDALFDLVKKTSSNREMRISKRSIKPFETMLTRRICYDLHSIDRVILTMLDLPALESESELGILSRRIYFEISSFDTASSWWQ